MSKTKIKKLSAWQLLELIGENPGATIPQLRQKLGDNFKNSNLDYHCHALIKKGLVRREKDISTSPYSPWYRYYKVQSNKN